MEDPEIRLSRGDWSAVVAPFGGSLRGVAWRGRPVATGYSGADNKVGGEGDVLIPFPGRIAGASYDFGGVTHQLEPTDRGGVHAIHGFVRNLPWNVVGESAHSASFLLEFTGAPGYPFPLEVSIVYSLEEDGLVCTTSVRNIGEGPAPVAVGFHPYFSVGSETVDGDTLTLPFDALLEFEDLIPTGRVLPVAGTALDFRDGRAIGETVIDNCFLNPTRDADGLARVRLTGPDREVTVWMDGSYDYCVLFTGDTLPRQSRRRALAIEPMSCGSDAFHHPAWGLRVLAPGETFHGTWGVGASER